MPPRSQPRRIPSAYRTTWDNVFSLPIRTGIHTMAAQRGFVEAVPTDRTWQAVSRPAQWVCLRARVVALGGIAQARSVQRLRGGRRKVVFSAGVAFFAAALAASAIYARMR